jgi:hypothetical protein
MIGTNRHLTLDLELMGNMSSKTDQAQRARQLAFGWALVGWVTQRRVVQRARKKGDEQGSFFTGFS